MLLSHLTVKMDKHLPCMLIKESQGLVDILKLKIMVDTTDSSRGQKHKINRETFDRIWKLIPRPRICKDIWQ
jgi:Mn-dependent DtxR family transcriptional regulator